MTISASIQHVMDSALEGIKSDLRSNLQNALPSAEQAARTIISNRFSAPGTPPAKATGAYASSWRAAPIEESSDSVGVTFTIRLVTSMPERTQSLEKRAGRPHLEKMREAMAEVIRRGVT